MLRNTFSATRLCAQNRSCLVSKSSKRLFTSTPRIWDESRDAELWRTRNIGIIAHIDAGKTTTTERMLYYSGFTRRIGDVDDGSTVTDFLPAERQRGITIQSAAITFEWPPEAADVNVAEQRKKAEAREIPKSNISHQINLIDTPGHADFTFEVVRSLRILDGAVCILDGVAGVEAQTEQVWHQASGYQIPRIIFVNKLDRDGAAFGRTVREVGSRLGGWPAVCQIPWFENGNGRFTGIADVINLRGMLWEEGGDGKKVKVYNLEQLAEVDSRLAEELKKARIALVELLSEHDDVLVEKFFEHEDHLAVSPQDILDSLRTCLLRRDGLIIPVFAGASFKNIGVQPLLDQVLNLLPDPIECPDPEISIGQVQGGLKQLLSGQMSLAPPKTAAKGKKKAVGPPLSVAKQLEACALAFKVVNDAKRGVLVYVRVYSGTLTRNALLYNTNLGVAERGTRLLKMFANEAVEVPTVEAGHIGVIVGLKHARTGDTLVAAAGNKQVPAEPLNTLQLRPIEVPPPVFFASIEPHSLSEQKNVADTLNLLLREDPSLNVTVDEDSGQTLLSGMGELHLEIARDRLINDFKAKASMGKIEIGYRECLLNSSSSVSKIFERETAGKIGKAGCTATVEPFEIEEVSATTEIKDENDDESSYTVLRDGNKITIRTPSLDHRGRPLDPDSPPLPHHLTLSVIRNSLLNGALAALARGPTHSFPIHSTSITLTFDTTTDLFGTDSSTSALSAAARLATVAALKDAASNGSGSAMMEPVMHVVISMDEESLGKVVHDISSSRGGQILALDDESSSSSDDESNNNNNGATTIDIRRIYAPPDPFGDSASSLDLSAPLASSGSASARARTVTAKVPLKEMVGYLKHLRSLTAGRGTFVMRVDRFERMNAQRAKIAISEMRGGV